MYGAEVQLNMGRVDPERNYESVVMGLRLFGGRRKGVQARTQCDQSRRLELKLSDVSIPKERSLDR